MARLADDKSLPPHLGHQCRPRGLACIGFAETGEGPDLVDYHVGRFFAQLAPSLEEPGDQLLSGIGNPWRGAVNKDGVLIAHQRYPAEPCVMAPAVFVHRFRSNPYSVLVFSYTPEEAV